MKATIKKLFGRFCISVGTASPWVRKVLRPLGVRCSHGLFGDRVVLVMVPGRKGLRLTSIDDSYLAFQLFWRGFDYYEPITRTLLEGLLRPGDTFLDLGAHHGFYSLATGIQHPGTRIIAFEPNPRNFRILQKNVEANGLTNLTCEQLAISDQDGNGILYLTESDMSASLMRGFQSEDTKQIGSVEVRTITLDSYVRAHAIGAPMVIKVDIEGHEPAFFPGAAETIARHKPDIILEVLYEQEPALVNYLRSLGYHFYPITDEGLVEVKAPKLFKRFPFLFLNCLISIRPKAELAAIFEQARARTKRLNLLETSKHFPPEEWPMLWRTEPRLESAGSRHLPTEAGSE